MRKVKVAIVGSGFLADMYARCYNEMSNVEIVAVSSRREEKAKRFAERFGVKSWYVDYEEMFKNEDVEAVNVCVPNYLHAPVTISAADHGKHVLCTKPLATSMEQAEDMVRTCKRSGVILMYGENWLFTPASYRIREIIDEGALGRILAVEAREQHSGSHSPYATKKEYCGGGVLIHMAVHPIGFIMKLMGRPVERVYAELGNLLHNIEVEDYALLTMRFKGGGYGVAHSNYITRGGMQERIEIYGSEGMAFIDLTHASPIKMYSEVGYSYVVEKASRSIGWTSPAIDEKVGYGFANMLHHFIECIIEDREPMSTGEFGLEVLRVVFAGYKSNEKGMYVTLH